MPNKFFEELEMPWQGAVIFLDVDGTLRPDGVEKFEPEISNRLEELKAKNAVYLVSNKMGGAKKPSRKAADGIDLHTRLQLNNLSETYDAITMVEVIEHLSNPVEVLTILSNHLNPNGVLYIEGSFTDTEYLYGNLNFDILKWWYLRPSIGHITLFNQKSMEVFLSKCGLKLIEPRFSANVFRATKES